MKGIRYYIGILALTLLLTLTHPGDFLRFLLGFELLLFLGMLLQVRLLVRNISVRWKGCVGYGRKGAPVRVELELDNRGRLPAPEIRVCLGCRDLLTGAVHYYTGTAMLDGCGAARLSFCLGSGYCGAVSLWIEEVRVWDYFGGWWGKCAADPGRREVSFLPEGTAALTDTEPELPAGAADGLAFGSLGSGGGEELSDTFEIRFFRQGDTLRRVHWKLFAKTDELLVRELAAEESGRVLVWLELRGGASEGVPQASDPKALPGSRELPCGGVTLEAWDRFLEEVSALSAMLLERGCPHDVMWREAGVSGIGSGAVVSAAVRDGEESRDMLAKLLRAAETVDEKTYGQAFEDREELKWDEGYGQALQMDLAGNLCRIREKWQ